MELLQGDAFDDLFRSFNRTAFHLELQDTYQTPEEAGPFDLFLQGEPDDFAWHQPWLEMVRATTEADRSITRVRVISVPHGAYTRWGLAVAPLNIDAGEDVRLLPRHLTHGMELTTDDYWLFDDLRVVFTVFEPSGRFAGGALTVDPSIVRRCRQAQDQVMARAVPFQEYISSN